MANDGFIEFLSPGALTELIEASALIDKLATQIAAINKFKAPTSPSGADGSGKKMTDDLKAQSEALSQLRSKIAMIASLNKQRYEQEAKLISDNDKALTLQSEKALAQIKAKQAMIASLNKQRYSEERQLQIANEKALLEQHQQELTQIKAKQAMIASLGQQRQRQLEQYLEKSKNDKCNIL